MYEALWKAVPGPTWAKVVFFLIVTCVVVAVLLQWVFPSVDAMLPSRSAL